MADQPHRGAQSHPLHQLQAQRGQIHNEHSADLHGGGAYPAADGGSTGRPLSNRIVPRPAFAGKETQLYEQALRRIRGGKCYFQPSLGLREFACYFEESDGSRSPISQSMDAGLMVYDLFTPEDVEVTKRTKIQMSLFHAVMENGVIQVPPYDSPEVLKGGSSC